MSTYYTILTDAGQVLLAEAISSGVPVVLTQFAVGDGNGAPMTPDASMTTLVNEVYRGSISSFGTNPEQLNAMVAQLIIPKESGGYTVREVAVFAEDGTMFSIGNYPDQIKPAEDSGYAAKMDLRYALIISDTSAITVVIPPGDYLTQEEADGRYVNKTGDTMTGPLTAGAGIETQNAFTMRNTVYPFGDLNFQTFTASRDSTNVTRWQHGPFQDAWMIAAYDAAGAWLMDVVRFRQDGHCQHYGTLSAVGEIHSDGQVTAGTNIIALGGAIQAFTTVAAGNGAAVLLADGNVLGPTWASGNLKYHIDNFQVGDIQYGAEVYFGRSAADWIFRAPAGHAMTGLDISPSSDADSVDSIYVKPQQKWMSGMWITVNG